jgi:murein L,D-transpeptidase YafK
MAVNTLLKFSSYAVMAACIALPYNATAVNHGSMANLSLTQKIGKNLIDSLLVKSLLEITQGQTKQALGTVDELIRAAPNFKLGYLIRGDILASQNRVLANFGDPSMVNLSASNDSVANHDAVEGLRAEARTRIDHYFSEKDDALVPNLMVKLGSKQQHLIVVDTVKSRLYLYKNTDNGLIYLADYYVTIGKNGAGKQVQGDKRTPIGVYFTSKKLTAQLDDMYGDAAYPLNFPNELDLHQNKSGSGIWLHGTPTGTYSRPPRASDGCVVLSNPDLKAIEPILQAGNVPIIISNKLEWGDVKNAEGKNISQASETESLQKAIETWRLDWAKQDTNRYLSHYSDKFFYDEGGLAQWSEHKREIQASKPKVSINLNNISMLSDPNANQEIVVVNFEQDFKSATLQNKMLKRQYWTQENNEWKIIYEGSV